MGESRLIVEEDFVFASQESPPSPPHPRPLNMMMMMMMMDSNSNVPRSTSFSYNRLPSQPLILSVLKLDASFFYVEVAKTATVAELKQAVEAVFSHMPQKGPGKISWPHVWGQFCLCYEAKKLVKETDYLIDYGIKDGDQLRFIRHVSNVCSFQRKRLKKRKHRRCKSTSQVTRYQQIEHSDDDDDIGLDDIDIENGKIQNCDEEEEEKDPGGKNRLTTGLLGGLFSYTRLGVVRRARTEGRNCPSMIARGILDSFRNIRRILCFCRRRHYSPRDTWSEY